MLNYKLKIMSNNTLIGICDLESLNENSSSWNVNKIGGQADWMQEKLEVNCSNCSKSMYLICQVYCPLQQSPYHRTLYIFACTNQLCWNDSKTWVALRSNVLLEQANWEEKIIVKSAFDELNINSLDWGEDANDYSNFDAEINKNFEFNKENEDLKFFNLNLIENIKPNSIIENESLSFKSYYINVFNEEEIYSSEGSDLKHENDLLQKYLQSEGLSILHLENQETNRSNLDDEKERYMNNKINKNFLKYKNAIHRCPNQVIRYSYGGQELILNDHKPDVPNCNCGSKRVFEFQLMPALLNYLHFKDFAPIEHQLEFGNILVYTCSKDCHPKATSIQVYQNEFIYVEYDETLNNLEKSI